MKKVFTIYTLEYKEVCVPSSGDYYPAWDRETIQVLNYVGEFPSEEAALDFMADSTGFIILPMYIKNK
jgi:hypothetical protein